MRRLKAIDPWIVAKRLIKRWLEAPVEEVDEGGAIDAHRATRNKDEGRGSPQGSPISPLLSNIYMRRFVEGVEDWDTSNGVRLGSSTTRMTS